MSVGRKKTQKDLTSASPGVHSMVFYTFPDNVSLPKIVATTGKTKKRALEEGAELGSAG
jgi:hypothetical protein